MLDKLNCIYITVYSFIVYIITVYVTVTQPHSGGYSQININIDEKFV